MKDNRLQVRVDAALKPKSRQRLIGDPLHSITAVSHAGDVSSSPCPALSR